jgi:hypothetical protein
MVGRYLFCSNGRFIAAIIVTVQNLLYRESKALRFSWWQQFLETFIILGGDQAVAMRQQDVF